jgi:carbon-monoxide dehydrogenase large subunit
VPSFELVAMETPTPLNPLGAKGVGEGGTIGAPAAVRVASRVLAQYKAGTEWAAERIWSAASGTCGFGRERLE